MIRYLYNERYWRSFLGGLIILLVGVWANIIAMNYINALNYNGISMDLLHELVPFNSIYSILAEVSMILSGILFIIYIIKYELYDELPFFMTCMDIFYIIRAIILPLTPLQNPYPDPGHFGIFGKIIPFGGAFPSGHTGFIVLLAFFVDNKRKIFKYIIGIMAFIIGVLMIISRGHYTIDVVGSVFIAFSVYILISSQRKSLFTQKHVKY